jgi:hypothetical protein
MVRKVKEFVEAKEIPSTPNTIPGKMLKDDSVKLVPEFYNDDEISSCMTGKKDFASVKECRKRLHKQKRYFSAS